MYWRKLAAIESLNTETERKLLYVQRAKRAASLPRREPNWPDSTATSGTTSWTWRCTRAFKARTSKAPNTALPNEGVTASHTSAHTASRGSTGAAASTQVSSCASRRAGRGFRGTYTRHRVTRTPSLRSVR